MLLSDVKLSLGVPFYGGVPDGWWVQMLQFVSALSKQVQFREVISCGTMTADHSRNLITDDFLKSDAEWLLWIDSDTMPPVGTVERLLGTGKTLVSGLYYGKNPPHNPIAYYLHNGAVTPVDMVRKWEKGEIIPVDAAGMGCMLTHRSVYEDIQKNYEVFQIPGGGLFTIHKNDILGDLDKKHEHDGKMYKGQLRQRAIKPTLANMRFPFFMVSYLRTEDLFFFDMARRVGHSVWLDTSVECGHLRNVPYTGADYRNEHGH
jgi:hypothetical protein